MPSRGVIHIEFDDNNRPIIRRMEGDLPQGTREHVQQLFGWLESKAQQENQADTRMMPPHDNNQATQIDDRTQSSDPQTGEDMSRREPQQILATGTQLIKQDAGAAGQPDPRTNKPPRTLPPQMWGHPGHVQEHNPLPAAYNFKEGGKHIKQPGEAEPILDALQTSMDQEQQFSPKPLEVEDLRRLKKMKEDIANAVSNHDHNALAQLTDDYLRLKNKILGSQTPPLPQEIAIDAPQEQAPVIINESQDKQTIEQAGGGEQPPGQEGPPQEGPPQEGPPQEEQPPMEGAPQQEGPPQQGDEISEEFTQEEGDITGNENAPTLPETEEAPEPEQEGAPEEGPTPEGAEGEEDLLSQLSSHLQSGDDDNAQAVLDKMGAKKSFPFDSDLLKAKKGVALNTAKHKPGPGGAGKPRASHKYIRRWHDGNTWHYEYSEKKHDNHGHGKNAVRSIIRHKEHTIDIHPKLFKKEEGAKGNNKEHDRTKDAKSAYTRSVKHYAKTDPHSLKWKEKDKQGNHHVFQHAPSLSIGREVLTMNMGAQDANIEETHLNQKEHQSTLHDYMNHALLHHEESSGNFSEEHDHTGKVLFAVEKKEADGKNTYIISVHPNAGDTVFGKESFTVKSDRTLQKNLDFLKAFHQASQSKEPVSPFKGKVSEEHLKDSRLKKGSIVDKWENGDIKYVARTDKTSDGRTIRKLVPILTNDDFKKLLKETEEKDNDFTNTIRGAIVRAYSFARKDLPAPEEWEGHISDIGGKILEHLAIVQDPSKPGTFASGFIPGHTHVLGTFAHKLANKGNGYGFIQKEILGMPAPPKKVKKSMSDLLWAIDPSLQDEEEVLSKKLSEFDNKISKGILKPIDEMQQSSQDAYNDAVDWLKTRRIANLMVRAALDLAPHGSTAPISSIKRTILCHISCLLAQRNINETNKKKIVDEILDFAKEALSHSEKKEWSMKETKKIVREWFDNLLSHNVFKSGVFLSMAVEGNKEHAQIMKSEASRVLSTYLI